MCIEAVSHEWFLVSVCCGRGRPTFSYMRKISLAMAAKSFKVDTRKRGGGGSSLPSPEVLLRPVFAYKGDAHCGVGEGGGGDVFGAALNKLATVLREW